METVKELYIVLKRDVSITKKPLQLLVEIADNEYILKSLPATLSTSTKEYETLTGKLFCFAISKKELSDYPTAFCLEEQNNGRYRIKEMNNQRLIK